MAYKKNYKVIFGITLCLILSFQLAAQIPTGYYDLADGKSGDELKATLNDIISGHTEFPYTSSSTDTWDILKEADRDPNNANNVVGIYSNFSMDGEAEYAGGNGWNREHVWAKSRGDFGTSLGAGTDCHHLRACDISTNSARSNRNFDECDTPYVDGSGTHSGATGSFTCSDGFVWKPRPEVIGDIARAIFYMATRYEGESGDPDLELTEDLQDNGSKAPLHARLSVLLAWHIQDPVTDAERARNDIVYGYQNNRNPFVDHPEYVASIWGGDATPVALIDVTSSLTDFGEVSFGEASATQTYTVSGTDLTDDISISADNGFEVSLTDVDANFGSNVVLNEVGGDVSMTTIYVRFNPESNLDASVNGVISHVSTGASTQTINVSGAELDEAIPMVNLTASLTDFGNVSFGEVSPTQSYTISGANLTEDISITSDNGFEISLIDEDADFGSSLTLTQLSGVVDLTSIFVRFKPETNENTAVSGTITHLSSGVSSETINLSGTQVDDATPIINLIASITDFGDVSFGQVSATQSYTISGTNLTGDILITADNGFELSLTDVEAAFGSSIQLVQTSGVVNVTSIFVRFNPQSDGNALVNGTITHQSDGVATETINTTGTEIDDSVPLLTIESSLTDFGSIIFGQESDPQSYTISGVNLTSDIAIDATNGFEVSLQDDAGFTSSLLLSPSAGVLNETIMHVRFRPLSDLNDNVVGVISHTADGVATQTIEVTGTELFEVTPEFNFNFSSRSIDPVGEYEVELFADIAPINDLPIAVELINSVELEYNVHYTTAPGLVNNIINATWPAGALSAKFSVFFETSSLSPTVIESLEFQLNSDDGYTVGANDVFVLTLKGDEVITGMIDIESNDLRVFPNPTNTNISISWQQHDFTYSIADMAGKTLSTGAATETVDIDISKLERGNYLLSINGDEIKTTRRISVY
jgi:endonuclease I